VNATPISEPDARALADAINQVSSNQSSAEALKLVEMALARAPQQPIVLNAAGGHMYRTGNARRARELYERAIAIDSGSKALWLNLAAACRTLGDTKTETVAIEKALEIEPRYVLALLQKGDLMERLGKPKAAAMVFGAALDSAASGAPVPQSAATALQYAQEVVRANNREMEAFLEQEVERVSKRHAGEDQRRYHACRDIFLGKRRAYTAAPKNLLFPYLPAIEFFPRSNFPWLDILEAATDDIAAEASAALAGDRAGFAPYVDFPPGTPIDQWAPLNHSMDWSVYSLWHDATPVPEHTARCPKTAAVLAQLPLCDIPNYAPGAYFSVLKPRTRLPPHTGTTNTRSIVHLPLVIPERCAFRVGADTRAWEKGRAWVFDDTIEHEAWNDSDQTRIILIFDIWNPFLSEAERDLVRVLTVGIGRYYGIDAPEMGSR
jgi:aspartyl/asparaginyl beta-hydroxylase (cupin superfamily)